MTLPHPKELGRAIESLANKEEMSVRRMRKRVATIALAQILLSAKKRGLIAGFAIKGGHAIEMRIRRRARASRDVDVIVDAPKAESVIDALRDALNDGWSGFTFAIKGDVTQTDHAFRFELSGTYSHANWATFEVEVMAGSAIDVDLVEPLNLAEFGLDEPELIPCLDLYVQLAQKFHGATDPSENRSRDLIDIYVLRVTHDFDRERLRLTAEQLFAERGRHSWPPTIELRDGWDREIAAVIAANDFPCTVEQVLRGVRAFMLELLGVAMKTNYEYHFIVLSAMAQVPNVMQDAMNNNDAMTAFNRMTREEGWRLVQLMRYPAQEVTHAMLAVLERPIEPGVA